MDTAAALTSLIDGRWADLRASTRDILDADRLRLDPSWDLEACRAHTTQAVREIRAAGFAAEGIGTPEQPLGDIGASVASFEMLAHIDLSLTVKVGVQFGLAGGAITALGTEEHRRQWLPGVTSMDIPACFAMTEVGHGSDVAQLQTTLTFDPATDEIVVHSPGLDATKSYIGNVARDGRIAVTFGRLIVDGTDHGVHAAIVPIRDEHGRPCDGVRIGDNGSKGGLRGVDNGTLHFTHVRVPRANLLSRYGGIDDNGAYTSTIESQGARFFTMLGALVRGRVSVAGAAAAAAREGLTIATRYGLSRRQFQAPDTDDEVLLLDYRAHQRKLLPRLATAYALAFAQRTLVETLHDVQLAPERDEHTQRELESRAAGMKALATEWAIDTLQTCREACGGAGYLADNRLTTLRADTDVFATFEGDNTVLLQLVAKGLLTHYKQSFEDMDFRATVAAGAELIGNIVVERTAARTLVDRLVATASRRGEDESVGSRSWQVAVIEEREKHVLETLAQRLRAATKREDMDAFTAFNSVQDHVLLAARAHMDRVVMEAFIAAIDACEHAEASALLERLCDLHALSLIERERAWYQEHNVISAARAKAVTAQVNALCEELRPHARTIIDGFGIPESWITSPIARDTAEAGSDGFPLNDSRYGIRVE